MKLSIAVSLVNIIFLTKGIAHAAKASSSQFRERELKMKKTKVSKKKAKSSKSSKNKSLKKSKEFATEPHQVSDEDMGNKPVEIKLPSNNTEIEFPCPVHSLERAEVEEEDENEIPRIVGGSEVARGKYPYMVYGVSCGATLVAPNVLLTAAHCNGFINKVQIGLHEINPKPNNYEEFNVKEAVPHPYYQRDTLDFDYMVLLLDGNSEYAPVELDDGSMQGLLEAGDAQATAIGWGTTSYGGPTSNVLMETVINLWTEQECKSVYPNYFTDQMICAASIGKDSCQGDSGGPLIENSTQKQIGIVSWGVRCALEKYPGVYSSVGKEYEWINSYIQLWAPKTTSPTPAPTATPTSSPTPAPTDAPSPSPTLAPTDTPTSSPTLSPTAAPTSSPTSEPSNEPTLEPTLQTTFSPLSPSAQTFSPTKMRSVSPSARPSSSVPSPSPTESTDSSSYVLLRIGQGETCPEGKWVPLNDCLIAAQQVGAGMENLRSYVYFNWPSAPCGCSIWNADYIDYREATGQCTGPHNSQLVCKK